MNTAATASLLLGLSASVLASPTSKLHYPRTEKLQWGECDIETGGLPVQCAKLTVPLDYTDKTSNKTLDLDVIKYPAQNGPSKGSILLNFGGPGQDGLNSMISYAPIQSSMTGGQHDLVSWDPRGTGNTLRFSCFENDNYSASLAQQFPDASDVSAGQAWADATIIAKSCAEKRKADGHLVGMAFTARDMMQIVDALGEDGLLHYWGISGGTALGATVAALFPDRMGRVILDGVMNSKQYYHSAGETEMLAATDATFEALLDACFETQDKCALARKFDSVDDLKEALASFFEDLKYNPIPVFPSITLPFALDYSTVKSVVVSSLYRPGEYQNITRVLDGLLEGNTTALEEVFLSPSFSGIPQQAEAVMGIRCGDKIPRAGSLEALEPIEEAYRETSKWFSGFSRGFYVYACAQWPFEAKERYEGDFQVKTKNPLLFIGNTYDPVTPLVSAQNMSSGFEGSVVLHHNGFGHLSITQPSNCTISAIQNYFINGDLPESGTVCEPNSAIFANDPVI